MNTKIECTIRRPGGSVVEFPQWPSSQVPDKTAPAARYHFKPASNDADAPHVATVTHRAHVDRLLSIPGYRLASDSEPVSLDTPPVIVEQATEGASPPTLETEGGEGGDTAGQGDAPHVDPVIAAIVELPVRDLKAKINTFSHEQLTAALAIEQAKEEPRKGFVEVIKAHLGTGADE